ncbi:MAG: lamin tail domain-containing protein, partial [Verrucomicrobiaceae bacterium]
MLKIALHGDACPRLPVALLILMSLAGHAAAAGLAVINEFNPKPEDFHELEEFIELHNPGDAVLDLTGWSLTDAVTYSFPNGTLLPAGGYVVVAMNPAALQARYGGAALGPWSGKLNSTGEKIVLKNGAGVTQDSVDYKFGFPWPCKIDGEGSSAELIHPSLENDKGSSWRSSGTTVSDTAPTNYIPASGNGWKYLKATAEPPANWQTTAFNDSAWGTSQAPFGYGDPDISTPFHD